MIAIKGMELPKSCSKCPMCRIEGWEIIYCYCDLGVKGLGDIEWWKERHRDCPLVEVDR